MVQQARLHVDRILRCGVLLLCCREKLRQLELPITLASKANPAFNTPSSRPQLAAAAASKALIAVDGAAVSAAAANEVQLQLNQDLVAATVKLDNASRRLEVLEREKDRLNKSLEEAQVSIGTVTSTQLMHTCCMTACTTTGSTGLKCRSSLQQPPALTSRGTPCPDRQHDQLAVLCVIFLRALRQTWSSGWPVYQPSCPRAGRWRAACSSAWLRQCP